MKKKWFDMIDSGEKTEEYREIKRYWMARLLTSRKEIDPDKWIWAIGFYASRFTHVQFRNGYSKTSPTMLFKSDGVGVFYGLEKWGAETGKKYFVIKLGERIS